MPRLLPKLSFINDKGRCKCTRLVRARIILREAKCFQQHIIQIPKSTKFRRAHMRFLLSCPDLILQRGKIRVLLFCKDTPCKSHLHPRNVLPVDLDVLSEHSACADRFRDVRIFPFFTS